MPGDRFSDEENRLTSDREATFTKRYFVGVVCVGVVVLFVTGVLASVAVFSRGAAHVGPPLSRMIMQNGRERSSFHHLSGYFAGVVVVVLVALVVVVVAVPAFFNCVTL
jgi:uncharacterized membrane protein